MTHHDTSETSVPGVWKTTSVPRPRTLGGRSEETDFIPTVADSVAPRQPLPPAARSSNIYKYSPYLYHSYRQWEMGSCASVYYNPSL